MTQISKKNIIAAVLVALALILTVTALVIAIVDRGGNDGDGKETDKAVDTAVTETVASDGDTVSTGDSEQTDHQSARETEKFEPDIVYESGEVSIDINDLA